MAIQNLPFHNKECNIGRNKKGQETSDIENTFESLALFQECSTPFPEMLPQIIFLNEKFTITMS